MQASSTKGLLTAALLLARVAILLPHAFFPFDMQWAVKRLFLTDQGLNLHAWRPAIEENDGKVGQAGSGKAFCLCLPVTSLPFARRVAHPSHAWEEEG